MKRLGLFVLFFLMSVEVATSQTARRTIIVGLPPYEFGASMETILKMNPTLQPIPPSWLNVPAFKGNFDFLGPGTISVHFWRGKLVYISVSWKSVDMTLPKFVYDTLIESYDLSALNVVRDHASVAPGFAGYGVILEDAQGSRLTLSITSSGGTRTTLPWGSGWLDYTWGEFLKANVPRAPTF